MAQANGDRMQGESLWECQSNVVDDERGFETWRQPKSLFTRLECFVVVVSGISREHEVVSLAPPSCGEGLAPGTRPGNRWRESRVEQSGQERAEVGTTTPVDACILPDLRSAPHPTNREMIHVAQAEARLILRGCGFVRERFVAFILFTVSLLSARLRYMKQMCVHNGIHLGAKNKNKIPS